MENIVESVVKAFGRALIVSVVVAGIVGCQNSEGPAERAGKNLDKATEQLGEKIEQAGEDLQKASRSDKR